MRLSVALLALLPPKLQALHRLRQSRSLYGLEHIVHGAGFKRRQSILVVGGDKDDGGQRQLLRPAVDNLGGGLQPALAWHADIEKQHIGLQLQRLPGRADAVGGHALDLQLGPKLAQHVPQGLSQQGFVFGNQCARLVGSHGADFKGNTMEAFVPPASSAIKLKVAAIP